MKKIAINVCHGGFQLSHKAILRYLEIVGKKVWVEENEDWEGHYDYWLVPKEERLVNRESDFWTMTMEEKVKYNDTWRDQNFGYREIARDDPALIQVIEELGEDSHTRYSELKIVEIPDEVAWQIDEYDGLEWVAEQHRTWS